MKWIAGKFQFFLGNDIDLASSLRYRAVPTFGTNTIRKFSSNVSELKKMAARDFEDILQVRIWHRRHYSYSLINFLPVRNPRV